MGEKVDTEGLELVLLSEYRKRRSIFYIKHGILIVLLCTVFIGSNFGVINLDINKIFINVACLILFVFGSGGEWLSYINDKKNILEALKILCTK